MKLILQTLMPLWTGGAEGRSVDRVHETSLVGALRWWTEAIVRGLGSMACDPDPRGEPGCPDNERNHCAVCELFGCTDWRRKFRLVAEYDEARCQSGKGLLAGSTLTLHLIEVKPLTPEERWLLGKAVEVICNHGAVGGKKTLKPPREDFGLLKLVKNLAYKPMSLEVARKYFHKFRPDVKAPSWPNLQWFFFVHGHYLTRLQMNSLMGLTKEGKRRHDPPPTALENSLGSPGTKVSKKLFSFAADGGRVWAYMPSADLLAEAVKRLQDEFQIPADAMVRGLDVLGKLE